MQRANGKRRFKFTKASRAQPSTSKHSQAQPSITLHSQAQPGTATHSQAQPSTAKHSQAQPAQPCTALHGPRFVLALFSAACCACTALVLSSLSFRPPASLAWSSSSFRSLFGRLLRLHGPRYLLALFSAACFACTACLFGYLGLFVLLFVFYCLLLFALYVFSVYAVFLF